MAVIASARPNSRPCARRARLPDPAPGPARRATWPAEYPAAHRPVAFRPAASRRARPRAGPSRMLLLLGLSRMLLLLGLSLTVPLPDPSRMLLTVSPSRTLLTVGLSRALFMAVRSLVVVSVEHVPATLLVERRPARLLTACTPAAAGSAGPGPVGAPPARAGGVRYIPIFQVWTARRKPPAGMVPRARRPGGTARLRAPEGRVRPAGGEWVQPATAVAARLAMPAPRPRTAVMVGLADPMRAGRLPVVRVRAWASASADLLASANPSAWAGLARPTPDELALAGLASLGPALTGPAPVRLALTNRVLVRLALAYRVRAGPRPTRPSPADPDLRCPAPSGPACPGLVWVRLV